MPRGCNNTKCRIYKEIYVCIGHICNDTNYNFILKDQRAVEERLTILEQQHISQNYVIDDLHKTVKEQEDVIANLNNKVKELDAGMVDLHSQSTFNFLKLLI